MKIVFVRHGKDDDRYRGGWSHIDLTPEGEVQAKLLAKHLKENASVYNIAQIISSDLPRTMTTAASISAELGLEIHPEPQLRETNNGDLAGMLNETALIQYPGLFFNTLEMDEPYPNGESPLAFYERTKAWFHSFCSTSSNSGGNSLIVTHGGVINIIYHLVNRLPWTNKTCSFPVAPCSVHVLNLDTMQFDIQNRTDFLYK